MRIILAIDTSCDETACAIVKNTTILANTIWSQASLHAKWGGVVPNIAKSAHSEHIDFVINKALAKAFPGTKDSHTTIANNIDAIAVTIGPGLAVALEVGLKKAKELAVKYKKQIIAVNHIEGHVLSSLAKAKNKTTKSLPPKFPALGVVTSGKHTELIRIAKMGSYKIMASTIDDALGEALDKAARMLGFGYPGGHIIEELAKLGDPTVYPLPIPLVGQEKRMEFSYSGLKAALFRQVAALASKKGGLEKKQTYDLAASFQKSAFAHLVRVTEYALKQNMLGEVRSVLVGGGVMANITLRKLLRNLFNDYSLPIHFPYSKVLYGDNAGMIGVAAHFKAQRGEFARNLKGMDRLPNLKIDSKT